MILLPGLIYLVRFFLTFFKIIRRISHSYGIRGGGGGDFWDTRNIFLENIFPLGIGMAAYSQEKNINSNLDIGK